MATCIHSSRSCLLPFYTIPIFPLLNRKIFHLLVNVVLLVMCCMCIPVFIVTSADISQLWVYLCYLLIYCLRLDVVVYKLVMFMERG